jgi:outer membrane protein assembly factor BamE (lipoprotein component of BamABCDE complex)
MSASAVVLLALAGCAENKLTRQNFDTIVEGQSGQDEVRMTLGSPYMEMAGQWEYEDEDKHVHATIHFDDRGKVSRKEWMDARTGQWDGAAPHIRQGPQGQRVSEQGSTTTIQKP